MAEKENFYDELDRKTKRSFCTCQTLAIGLVLLMVIAVFGVVSVVRKVSTVVSPKREVVSTLDDKASLQQKFQDLSQAEGASTSLTITERELTSALIDTISKDASIPLRELQAEIDRAGIVLTGMATQVIATTISVSLIPKVVDGKVVLELTKIQAGSFAVPQVLTEQLARKLETVVSEQMAQLQNVTIKSVTLSDGAMTVTGTVGSMKASSS